MPEEPRIFYYSLQGHAVLHSIDMAVRHLVMLGIRLYINIQRDSFGLRSTEIKVGGYSQIVKACMHAITTSKIIITVFLHTVTVGFYRNE